LRDRDDAALPERRAVRLGSDLRAVAARSARVRAAVADRPAPGLRRVRRARALLAPAAARPARLPGADLAARPGGGAHAAGAPARRVGRARRRARAVDARRSGPRFAGAVAHGAAGVPEPAVGRAEPAGGRARAALRRARDRLPPARSRACARRNRRQRSALGVRAGLAAAAVRSGRGARGRGARVGGHALRGAGGGGAGRRAPGSRRGRAARRRRRLVKCGSRRRAHCARYAARPMAAGRLARSFAWIVLVLLAAAPARAAGDAFLPLGPGARWEYSVHRDHSYRPDAGPADRTFRAGTRVLEYIAPREEGGEVRHELRDRRQETPTSPGLPPSLETSREIWSA